MPLRKNFIASTTLFSSLLPLSLLRAFSGKRFIMPFYHVVSDEPCPHIKHLYRFKNTKQFESDIDYLASHYKPIAATDLNDVCVGKYNGQNTMLLTFDDGLRQTYEVVAPILLRKGIPAVFFLNTGFLDNRGLMFRYKASLAAEKDVENKDALLAAKSEEELKKITRGNWDAYYSQFLADYKPYLGADQVQWLSDKGFAIGAHSCSHPLYNQLDYEKQLDETLRSTDILQHQFNLQQRLFSFPFTDDGVSRRFFDEIFTTGKMDFTFGGAGIKNDVHPRHFQRFPLEGPEASAEQILKSEYLYFLLRAPLFKNTIRRT